MERMDREGARCKLIRGRRRPSNGRAFNGNHYTWSAQKA